MNSSDSAANPPIASARIDPAQALEVSFESDQRRRQRMLPLLAWPQTHSSFVGYVEVAPGDLEMPHCHSAEEIVYVIEGSLEMTVGEQSARAEAGDVLAVPAGAMHAPKNVGDGVLRLLVFLSSSVSSHTFEDVVQPLGAATFVTPLS